MPWTTPLTITGGQTAGVATAFNSHATDLALIGGAWTAYTPTTTGITLGNGTVTGRFKQVDKTIDFQCTFTFGSTSAITANVTFTLPVTALGTNWGSADCVIADVSASQTYPAAVVANTTTTVITRIWPVTAGNPFGPVSSTAPMTWATSDTLIVQGRYEAA